MTTSIIRMLLAMSKFFVFNAGLNGDNLTYIKTSELLVAPSGRDYVPQPTYVFEMAARALL